MDDNKIPDNDFVLIGATVNTLLLAVLLSKENYGVILFEDEIDNERLKIEEYDYIPLDFLRAHSIPYSELSIKNKSADAFIERNVDLEKYFFPKLHAKDSLNWMFFNSKQLGIVNMIKFRSFIKSLVSKYSKIKILPIDKNFSIKKRINDEILTYEIQSTTNTMMVAYDKMVFSDTAFNKYLGEIPVKNTYQTFKYSYKVEGIFSDSISHYFFNTGNEIDYLSIFPCSSFSIIEYTSTKEFVNSISEIVIEFLKNKFEISVSDLFFLKQDLGFRKMKYTGAELVNIIPEDNVLAFPFIMNFFTSLKSAFYLSLCLESNTLAMYNQWLISNLVSYTNMNDLLFGENKDINLNKLGKLLNNKDIRSINIISKQIVDLRFALEFKQQGLSKLDLKSLLQILTHSIDYKN